MKKFLISSCLAGIFAGITIFSWEKAFPTMGKPVIHEENLNMMLLEYAALGRAEDVEILLKRGANKEAIDKDGRSAFMIAALEQNFPVAACLASRGADINSTAYNRSTVLLLAVDDDQLVTVRFLIEQGADCSRQDSQGSTPLILASMRGYDDIVKLLLKQCLPLETEDDIGYTALAWAVTNGHESTAKLLVEAGANVNVSTWKEFNTPLLTTVLIQNDPKMLELFLQAKVDLTVVNTGGENALHRAIEMNKTDYAKRLIDAGIDVNRQTDEGISALMFAAEAGDLELVKLLLARGADTSAVDKKGRNAFQYCDVRHHRDIATLLKPSQK